MCWRLRRKKGERENTWFLWGGKEIKRGGEKCAITSVCNDRGKKGKGTRRVSRCRLRWARKKKTRK